jgi:superfamily II DNA/RNA helicase
MDFSDLGLSGDLLRAVTDAGYQHPTPIQEQAIPIVLMGRDILGCAQTGTGKTASFTLPMIEILAAGRAKSRMPRSLILEPTRELATQVAQNFETYGKYHRLSKALFIGGESMAEQLKVLDRGADVLIATPGRLLDVFDRGHLLLTGTKILVIDEADRMLDMGFIPDVERIVSIVSRMRQTLFFSATMPPAIRKLADAFLRNPKEITVSPPSTPSENVVQGLLVCEGGASQKEKRDALRHLLRSEDVGNALIFCNRKREVGVVCRSLLRHGYDVAMLHGDMAQSARTEVLERFKRGEIKMLVCSDVAARGLDIAGMSHVFNFDVPTAAEDYVHRIGRTARAGLEGRALTIATPEDGKYVAGIEQLIGREIPRITVPEVETAELDMSGGKSRRRKSDGERRSRRTGRPASPSRKPAQPSSRSQPRPQSPAPEQPDAESRPEPRVEPRSETRVDPRPEPRARASAAPRKATEHKATEQPAGSKKREPRRDRGKPDSPVVGMGDHVPAFMMRDVKFDKKS